MAQLPSNLAAHQAAVPPSDTEAGPALPSDLMTLSLEDLMGLRVGSGAEPDWDDVDRDRGQPTEVLSAVTPPGNVPGGAPGSETARPAGNSDLPADLTALDLAQLMNLPLRTPQAEPEEEPEVAENDAEDGETVPQLAQTEAGRAAGAGEAGEAPPPPATAGAAFSAPDLDGDAEADPEDPEDSPVRGAPEGDDTLEGTALPGAAGAVRRAALLDAGDDTGPNAATATGAFDPAPGSSGGGDLNLIGGAGNDILLGGSGNDSLTGNGGDDRLDGGNGRDRLDGGAGNDRLDGGNGRDTLDGGAGSDRLDGGNGKDTLSGGGGDDSLVWDRADGVIDGGGGQDTLLADAGDIDLASYSGAITSIEQVEMAGDGADSRLTLGAQDVLDISSTDILTISGDVGDSLEAGSGWTDGGVVGAVHVYTQGLAALEVDLDVTVNADMTF